MSLSWENYNFQSEYVDGFYVMEMVKRSWAAQLEVYDIIRNICEKHDIRFFADWGTLLGAVRHNGFVPWDDDMDIGMKRKDLMKFLSVAGEELPEGFLLLSPYCNAERKSIITRVVNSGGVCFSESHLAKFHNCPYVVGLDIFPIDTIPREQEKMEQQRMLLNYMREIDSYISMGTIGAEELEDLCNTVSSVLGLKLSAQLPVTQRFYILWDQLCGMYSEADGDELSSIYDFAAGWDYRIPKSEYGESIAWPFMQTSIPVPVGYDHILRVKYRNYERKKIGGSSHMYPAFRDQENMLKAYLKKNEMTLNPQLQSLLEEKKYYGNLSWPVAVTSFAKMRQDGYYYTDKTEMLVDFAEDKRRLRLIIQPAKAGKSLAEDIILNYFGACKVKGKEVITGVEEFQNTNIPLRNSKVVLGLGFDNIVADTPEQWTYGLHRKVWELCFRYKEEFLSAEIYDEQGNRIPNHLLTPEELRLMNRFFEQEGRGFNWLEALSYVVKAGAKYYHRPVWILLDAYDSFLKQAYDKGFGHAALEEFAKMCRLLSEAEEIEKILIFARNALETEKLFGISYREEDSIRERRWFYWNEEEVKEMLAAFDQSDCFEEVKEWYMEQIAGDGGYSYHPWNIINYSMSMARGAKEPFLYQKICGEMDH
ncbi:MAG: LicD family protein [Lachnospiraceae bacterium]